jgi:hypothetical protein
MEVNGHRYDPTALLPEERAPVIHWIRGWVGHRASLDAVEKRKISYPSSSALQPVSKFNSCSHNCVRNCISDVKQVDLVTVLALLGPSPARSTTPLTYIRSQIPH